MRFTIAGLMLASLIALAGCGGAVEPAAGPKILNEQRGTYEGVGIGSSSAAIRARFGTPSSSQGFIPLEPPDVRGPFAFSVPGRVTPEVMRYDRVAFILAHDRVFGFITSDASTVLTRKVGVGDSLDSVRHVYPLSCRDAPVGESADPPDAAPTYTLCRAELANGSQLVVTKDPVESITLLRLSAARP